MAEIVVRKSQRFTKAARAERDRLARRRSQLLKRREDLQDKIDSLDVELEAVDQEISVLESFALTPREAGEIAETEARGETGPHLLSGAEIRILAVHFLLREQGTSPIHYRAWLGLLTREGYAVAGKRPDAVFLNQVVRSPLVKATTQSGYYEIDLGVVDRLREQLRKQQSELAEFMSQAPTEVGVAFDEYRERQRTLNTAIARTERELDEAVGAIQAWEGTESFDAMAA
jgi:predicted nuclease with TOPRIM domain